MTLVTGGIFSLSAYLSYDYAITHVIRWHMEPIMRLLIAAEEGRTLRKGERLSVDSELLACKGTEGKMVRRGSHS